MSDIWQPRDLAVCIRLGEWKVQPGCSRGIPRCGQLLEVDLVVDHPEQGTGLGFREFVGQRGLYKAALFLKVTPGAPDAEDLAVQAEFQRSREEF
jgi:hypothetical protein